VVVAPAVRAAGWVGVTGLAAVVLTALALHGQRPDSSVARFEAAGVMRDIEPRDVAEVRVARGAAAWRFRRAGEGRWTLADGAGAADPSEAVEQGLRYLHVSAPQRIMERDEVPSPTGPEFGLTPPRCIVEIRAARGPAFTITFGALNAQGLAQYARIHDRDELFLLPRYVGQPWETATAPR
jgi:hypothetical protein